MKNKQKVLILYPSFYADYEVACPTSTAKAPPPHRWPCPLQRQRCCWSSGSHVSLLPLTPTHPASHTRDLFSKLDPVTCALTPHCSCEWQNPSFCLTPQQSLTQPGFTQKAHLIKYCFKGIPCPTLLLGHT